MRALMLLLGIALCSGPGLEAQGIVGRLGRSARGPVPPPSAPPAGAPEEAAPLPPLLEPLRGPVERRDLHQQFRPRHPIEGAYELREAVRGNARGPRGTRGYLWIGNRHLSLHLYAPGDHPGQANFQAVFRRYRIEGDQLVMSTLLGHRNQVDGDVALERIGHVTRHRFTLLGTRLRIASSAIDHLEFVRIE